MHKRLTAQLLRRVPAIKAATEGSRQYAKATVDFLLPPRCVMTGDIVDRPGMLSPTVWGQMSFITAPFCHVCGKPFEFEPEGGVEAKEGLLCLGCIQYRPAYDLGRSAVLYDEHSKNVILRFKYADQTHIALTLAAWLKRAGENFLPHADVLVPVPLHRMRLLKRRYNQSALLAQALSRQTGIKCLPDGLCRTRFTPSQGHMNFKERRRNVRRAFTVHPRYDRSGQNRIEGAHVVLIDDVYTSGATINECAKALKEAGAATVYSLTVARTAGTDYFR